MIKSIIFLVLFLPMVSNAQTIKIKWATGYPPLEKHTDSTPFITAMNKRVFKCGIAFDRNMTSQGAFLGCRVQITGIIDHRIRLDGTSYCNKLYVINDKMAKKPANDMSIDLFFFKLSDALKFGRFPRKGSDIEITMKILWCD